MYNSGENPKLEGKGYNLSSICTGLIRDYFKQVKFPIIREDIAEELINSTSNEETSKSLKKLSNESYNVLKFILELLHKVSVKNSQMNPKNLCNFFF